MPALTTFHFEHISLISSLLQALLAGDMAVGMALSVSEQLLDGCNLIQTFMVPRG